MRPWMHVAFWFASVFLGGMAVVMGVALLHSAGARIPPPNPRTATYLLEFTIGLAVVLVIWRRYWFLPSDLVALLEARGARVERRHGARRTFRARIGDVWLVATLDRPIRGYWPSRLYRITRQGLLVPIRESGFRPGYMLTAAHVELILPGDFTRLPRITLTSSAHALRSDEVQTGDAQLDRAVRDAAAVIREPSCPLVLEIADGWLRLATAGGSWLGAQFGRRINDLLASMDNLSNALAGRFAPAADASVQYERGKVYVVTGSQATGRGTWKALRP